MIISEFFVAILNENIVFDVDGSRIDASNLLDLIEDIEFSNPQKGIHHMDDQCGKKSKI